MKPENKRISGMKFENIPGRHLALRLRSPAWRKQGPDDPFAGYDGEVPVRSVSTDPSRSGAFKVVAAGLAFPAVADSPAEARSLSGVLSSSRSMLAILRDRDALGGWLLEIVPFASPALELGDLEIETDGKTAKLESRDETFLYRPAAPRRPDGATPDPAETECFFFVKPGSAWKWHADPGAQADKDLREAPDEVRKSSFCVFGADHRFIVSRQTRPGDVPVEFFAASKATRWRPGRIPDPTIRPARGTLRFTNRAEGLRMRARAQMDVLLRDEKSYLRRWDDFNALEGNTALEKARLFGAVPWTHAAQKAVNDGRNCWRLSLADLSGDARVLLSGETRTELELAASVPEWIARPEMTLDDIFASSGGPETPTEDGKAASDPTREETAESKPLPVLNWTFDPENACLDVCIEADSLPREGFVVVAMTGFIHAMRRRNEARLRIQAGASANPMLGTLLEEEGVPEPLERRQRVDALSDHSLALFRDKPTLAQTKAIDIALNTPDIALIQGPPGTGKTTVIAAILDRLNELSPKKGADKGSVLLSAFQHDAVDNMIDRIRINSIPVQKFGRRNGRRQGDDDSARKQREEWCRNIANAIRKKNPQLAELEEEKHLRNLFVQYNHSSSEALAESICRAILDLPAGSVAPACRERAAALRKRAENASVPDGENARLLRFVRALRTSEAAFRDDGPDRADDLLDELQQLDSPAPEERALLERASRWLDGDDLDFLPALRDLKHELMIRVTERAHPEFIVEKRSHDIDSLARDALQSIRETGRSAKDRRAAALLEFVETLEGDPDGMIHSVADYCFAFAATCQQCANWQIATEKGLRKPRNIGEASPPLEYEYVIIDEAARATPLDLLIPMSQGRRILLVGDHRQLPQMVDDELAAKLESGASREAVAELEDEKWWKQSMFQYLFTERLPRLEARDGIQRRVTLDAQFRMHPDLGRFVSANFYEEFDPQERFDSPLSADCYTHGLPVPGGGPALWIDVPDVRGPSTSGRTGSLVRECEIDAIVSRLRAWMDLDEARNAPEDRLTFGVISFYRGQAEAIKERLGAAVDGKRLHVGTVDSFQGKEFDVVFLSLVRTSRSLGSERPFGFLTVYNRLNVAMSRQKKLLAVVGDAALVDNDRAAESVWGLHGFLALCRENGAVEEGGR